MTNISVPTIVQVVSVESARVEPRNPGFIACALVCSKLSQARREDKEGKREGSD
jgi:hypothetical protein